MLDRIHDVIPHVLSDIFLNQVNVLMFYTGLTEIDNQHNILTFNGLNYEMVKQESD